jgi:hypothetical protein
MIAELDLNLKLLRNCAYIELDQSAQARILDLAANITDWQDLINKAESNGLSSLLLGHLTKSGVVIPRHFEITLKVLGARHQRANRVRTSALVEVLEKFSEQQIESILLKGMALIHTLYTELFQRPMGDIDILVSRENALTAQQLLRDLGYVALDRKTGYLYDHHHLPVASKLINGLTIQIEIHHDALSGDSRDTMPFNAVHKNTISITVDTQATATMGHADMLNHLCHHTFEPCERIKLGAVADIYGYASRYHNEIDWSSLQVNYPRVINTLRWLHFLTPLPKVLRDNVGVPDCKPPSGVGEGFLPLSITLESAKPVMWKLRQIFCCSDWWLANFYEVAPEKSLLQVKIIGHPIRVAVWFYRRLWAKLRS